MPGPTAGTGRAARPQGRGHGRLPFPAPGWQKARRTGLPYTCGCGLSLARGSFILWRHPVSCDAAVRAGGVPPAGRLVHMAALAHGWQRRPPRPCQGEHVPVCGHEGFPRPGSAPQAPAGGSRRAAAAAAPLALRLPKLSHSLPRVTRQTSPWRGYPRRLNPGRGRTCRGCWLAPSHASLDFSLKAL